MRRRGWLLGAGAGLAGLAAPQHARVPAVGPKRVGLLAPSTREREEVTLRPFFDEMRRLGWVEGQTVSYDRAYADDSQPTLLRLAAELVARKPDLIFAPPSPAAVAARQATALIPIVFATGIDPVGIGLVASLARPGGNVTGVLSVVESLAPKLVEMLREVLPGAKRLGVLTTPGDPRSRINLAALAQPAKTLGLKLLVVEVGTPSELSAAVAKLHEQRADAILTSTSLLFNWRVRLLELSNAKGLPVIGSRSELAEAGALMSYGASLAGQLRRAAALVDKVLKGASPAEMPVEQPTRFELVINLKAAKALGLTIPQSLLLRADEVIE